MIFSKKREMKEKIMRNFTRTIQGESYRQSVRNRERGKVSVRERDREREGAVLGN